MEQVEKIVLSRFRNNEHFQYMTDVNEMVIKATPTALNLDGVFPEYSSSYTGLDKVLRVDQGSIKTELLIGADGTRDNTWRGLFARVKSTLLSPVPEEVESSKIIKRVFDLYGIVHKLSYNEQTAATSNLIDDLEAPANASHCSTISITAWVTLLKEQNNSFQNLLNERNSEYANKISGDVKAARQIIDPLYEKMVERINATVVLDMATPEAQKFIKELNQKIKYYETTLVSRAGKKDAEGDNEPLPEETE